MNPTFRILAGHFLDVAKEIPDASIQCAVSSVPYYGLRSYGTEPQVWDGKPKCRHRWQPIKQYKDSWRRAEPSALHHGGKAPTQRNRTPQELHDGRWTCTAYCDKCQAWRGELGQEPSPALYTQHLVQIFAEVWRVLRPDGTLFVNIGDAYYNYRPCRKADTSRLTSGNNGNPKNGGRSLPVFGANRGYKIDGLKEKDLIGLPWLLAFAMRDFGWYWRSEIIWYKPNPLSESVTDRPTKSHEPILMFTKAADYFYDKWAITETPTGNAHARIGKNGLGGRVNGNAGDNARSNESFRLGTSGTICPGGRNKRTVWKMNVQGYQGDEHFAAFPEELPLTCILAGTSAAGCCRQCGAPWTRFTLNPDKQRHRFDTLEERYRRSGKERGIDVDTAITGDSITLGWARGCKCYAGAPVPQTVLDPFAGRGTTGCVAVRFGRTTVLVDLQKKYVTMIRRNLLQEAPLWVTESSGPKTAATAIPDGKDRKAKGSCA